MCNVSGKVTSNELALPLSAHRESMMTLSKGRPSIFNNDDFSPAATEAESSHPQLGLLQRLLLLLQDWTAPEQEQQFVLPFSLLAPMTEKSGRCHAKNLVRGGVHGSRSFCAGVHD